MPRKRSHTIGYLRVSTPYQDTAKNQADILMLAHRRTRKIAEVLDMLHKGDARIVSELSRLGRSMLECMEILALATQKGIHVYAVKGNWQLDGSMQSKIMALAFAMAAEIECDLISQRTKEALRARKSAGIKLGRPKGPGKSKLDPYQSDIEALLAHGSTQKYIAQHYRVTEATVSRWRKRRGVQCPSVP